MLDLLDRMQDALDGRYRIESEIGHGGMAVVYLAHDPRHERTVALKVLYPEFSQLVGAERFLREIKVAARLHHPHLLPLYDSGKVDRKGPAGEGPSSFLYYVTPYVEGGSLRGHLAREARLGLAVALRLAREVADALDYAHRHQVVHRDIKPENILLEEGHAIVADFGVARALSAAAETEITQPGILIGTPAYMSPEQCTGEAIDGRSDIYSLGCVLYEMLAGHPPFQSKAPIELVAARLIAGPPSLRSAGVSLPPGVEHLVERAMAQQPEDRFPTAADFALALGLAERGVGQGTPTPPGIRAVSRVATLAVLPFVNMSTDPDNEYFSDGMTEELINALTRVPGLKVASRTSAFTYKGRDLDVREIGRQLNVNAVLEGSVRRAGSRLRVTAQLINAADGYHLWSETYDRQLADVFEVQDELSRSIMDRLRPRLMGAEPDTVVRPATNNVEAYTAYLKGRFVWNKRTLEGYRKGIDFFERALRKDPEYALAYTGIADCWAMLGFDYFGGVPPTEGMPKAKAAALEALKLNDSLPEAKTPLAVVSMLYDWDRIAAEEHFKLALQLDPGYVPARTWYAYLLTVLGRHDESVELIQRTAELEPLSLMVQQTVARSLHYAGRCEEAVEQCRRVLDMDPDFVTGYEALIRPLCQLGRLEEAEEAALEGVERSGRWSLLLGALGYVYGIRGKEKSAWSVEAELRAMAKRQYVSRYHFALVYYGFRDRNRSLEGIEQAIRERSGVVSWIAVEPICRWLMPEPRFQRALRDLKLDS